MQPQQQGQEQQVQVQDPVRSQQHQSQDGSQQQYPVRRVI